MVWEEDFVSTGFLNMPKEEPESAVPVSWMGNKGVL